MKILAFLFSLISFNSLACSCMGYDIEEAFEDYPVVFSGVVESVDTIKVKEDGWFEYSKLKAVTLVVDHSYKGMTAEKIKVTTRVDSAACGFPFEEKVKYVVFAIPDENGLFVGSCGPTIHMEKREEYYEPERLRMTRFLSKQIGT
ncbi:MULTISPECIES: hypothetical protein [Alteromonas]|uniref:Tissue inhibitor of metalloproteinase n=1 Tax=Alteromonas stellipolaris TaxID=233316 RepID=A0AAW7Z0Z5_9ALTE|nr:MULTISPECIES: hypothetical protein [Alteromonas]AMJ85634.1 hypothetical protein AV939_02950 [Alteromonas sp. Mac1]MDO6577079.1 hypothetical protein [Alteromonas stellipolaris]MDP2596575.1 hypothetical protein [Alteromonas stellipolaris]